MGRGHGIYVDHEGNAGKITDSQITNALKEQSQDVEVRLLASALNSHSADSYVPGPLGIPLLQNSDEMQQGLSSEKNATVAGHEICNLVFHDLEGVERNGKVFAGGVVQLDGKYWHITRFPDLMTELSRYAIKEQTVTIDDAEYDISALLCTPPHPDMGKRSPPTAASLPNGYYIGDDGTTYPNLQYIEQKYGDEKRFILRNHKYHLQISPIKDGSDQPSFFIPYGYMDSEHYIGYRNHYLSIWIRVGQKEFKIDAPPVFFSLIHLSLFPDSVALADNFGESSNIKDLKSSMEKGDTTADPEVSTLEEEAKRSHKIIKDITSEKDWTRLEEIVWFATNAVQVKQRSLGSLSDEDWLPVNKDKAEELLNSLAEIFDDVIIPIGLRRLPS